MNGDKLLSNIRRRLRDYEAINKQGLFWSNEIIRLFMNQAQLVFFNYCLKEGKHHLLTHLIKTEYISGASIALTALSYEYAHAAVINIADIITTPTIYRPSKIYIGAESVAFEHIEHYAGHIRGGDLTLKGSIPGDVISFNIGYYTYPDTIRITGHKEVIIPDVYEIMDEDTPSYMLDYHSFDEHIYNDVILPLTMVMLGQKETVNQREYKILKGYVDLNKLFPSMQININRSEDRFEGIKQ